MQKKYWLAGAVLLVILITGSLAWRIYIHNNMIIGGHCLYDSAQLGARVLRIATNKDEIASGPVLVTVEVMTKDRGADTVNMCRLYPYSMYTEQDWAQANLKPGDTIKCTYFREVGGGSCEPYIYQFLLERYYQQPGLPNN